MTHVVDRQKGDIRISLEQLDALRPCAYRRNAMVSALDWSKPVDAAQAVAAGATFDDIVWVAAALARRDPDVERRLRLWIADCAARVLHIFERERPTDMRPRDAILSARRYARGEIDDAARDVVWAATKDAWDAGADGDAASAARAARAAVGETASAAASLGSFWAARAYAGAAEKRWQLDRLVARMSANEPEDWPLDKKEAV